MKSSIKTALVAAVGLWLILLAGAACQNGQSPEPTEKSGAGSYSLDGTTQPGTEPAVSGAGSYSLDGTTQPGTEPAGSGAGSYSLDGTTQPGTEPAASYSLDGTTQPGTEPAAALGAVVTGTVAYRERIALPPGAVVEVELRDVSLLDAASTLIARQVIANPGQPPISFRLEYDREDISAGATYAVQARITYPDGSLGFINDTAHEVITQGRPSDVDMLLTMVSPPPGVSPDGDWVEVPARVRRVDVEERDGGYLIRAIHSQPGGADCSRLSSLSSELVDANIYIEVRVQEKRAADGSPACASAPQEGAEDIVMEGPFTAGRAYRVRVNGQLTNIFTPPREGFPDSRIALSPIEDADVVVLEIYPPKYDVVVFSALPKGSSCSQFNGFSIDRPGTGRIDVSVTHHEALADDIPCTEDYPVVETAIPLGNGFEPGKQYAVVVNADTELTFRAQ